MTHAHPYVAESAPAGITVEYFAQLVIRYGSDDDIPLSEIDIVEYRRTSNGAR